uniref:RNA cytidine acetyltransferase n=1 Tax=Rhabditophanes sp. KR3021 TaxID=114890 RepID=A0AC35U057_9BILA
MTTELDQRIKVLIGNGIVNKHRSMFAVVGSKAKDQVTVLYQTLVEAKSGDLPNVLWCKKNETGLSGGRQSKGKKDNRRSSSNFEKKDQTFPQFTSVRHCNYADSHELLGNTFGMLILQDFEALTPNLLARTIETVEGGGLIVFLMTSVNSLKELFVLPMDVHSRYKTNEAVVVPRFNERFVLSLNSCKSCLVTDDKLSVLAISSHVSSVVATSENGNNQELDSIKESVADTKPIGDLVATSKTKCQARALLSLLDVITEKNAEAIVSLTAARGRGKSAVMGLAISGAVAFGYGNIFVTSPSPDNVKTLFEFVVQGLVDMGYKEDADYFLTYSGTHKQSHSIVRVDIQKENKQCIQYINPTEAIKLGQADLLVIDEAAAIPLPTVSSLMNGNYITFLASTIKGYEGTGRSLSLKLLAKLREKAIPKAGDAVSGKRLVELTLEESIRYRSGDEVENWLDNVLCLNATTAKSVNGSIPPSRKCELYYVNKDTLFSYHKSSEAFLNTIMAIYVSAHYKNTPDDLQMLADAPNHHLFVLMGPTKSSSTEKPDVLAVVQICYEGNLKKGAILDAKRRGKKGAGDLIPWNVADQFNDSEFPSKVGGRIVRIAVHPDFHSMGYGQRCMELVGDYYQGKFPCLANDNAKAIVKRAKLEPKSLNLETIAPRENPLPILLRLDERQAEGLDYLGVSFGLTPSLLNFWQRSGMVPIYLRQTVNDLTGENTLIMLKALDESLHAKIHLFEQEFVRRFLSLLGYGFKSFPTSMTLALIGKPLKVSALSRDQLAFYLSNTDMKRLHEFGRNLADQALITDILPVIGKLYFTGKLGQSNLVVGEQAKILIGLGLQHRTLISIGEELNLPKTQLQALFIKAIKKISDYLDAVCLSSLEEKMNGGQDVKSTLTSVSRTSKLDSLEQELAMGAQEIKERQERDKVNLKRDLLGKKLAKYALPE